MYYSTTLIILLLLVAVVVAAKYRLATDDERSEYFMEMVVKHIRCRSSVCKDAWKDRMVDFLTSPQRLLVDDEGDYVIAFFVLRNSSLFIDPLEYPIGIQ